MSETKTISATALVNALREKQYTRIAELLTAEGEEVLKTKGAQLVFPAVDAEGNDLFVRVTVEVPKGSRDGTPYDGYAEAEAYKAEQAEKAEKKAEVARKKAEKEAKKAAPKE